jgi:hypothetical protein
VDSAVELKELEAMRRQLEAFLARGELERPIFDQIRACIRARRRALLGAEAAPNPAGKAAVEPSLSKQLQDLLGACQDVRDLSATERRQALALYRQLSEAELGRTPAASQLLLARLLRIAGLSSRARQAYRRLLERFPEHHDVAAIALEAGRFAARDGDELNACWFLELALRHRLPADARREAEQILRTLRPAVEEPILDVLPVDEAPVAPAVVAEPRPRERQPVEAELPHRRPHTERDAPHPKLEVHGVPPREPVRPPKPPRRSLGEVLAAFMEERNILWGELVGGLLIVGCSVALIVYLWQTNKEIPYFPFFVVAGVTAALFGAGLYTLHRWKLETTSRGMLVIATLLVPLSFLVMAGQSLGRAVGPFDIGMAAAAVSVFAWLVSLAARVLAGRGVLPGGVDGRWLLTAGVMIPSAVQLLVPRCLDPSAPATGPFVLLGLVPVLCLGGTTAAVLLRAGRAGSLCETEAHALFGFLGMALFPLAVMLGFLVYWCDEPGLALQRAAVLIALAGVPVLATGLVVHSSPLPLPVPVPEMDDSSGTGRGTDAGREVDAVALSGPIRTVGTAIALAGLVVLLTAVALAWPGPRSMVLVCALDFAVLTIIAWRYRWPVAHAGALPCLVVGYLTAFHLLAGNLNVAYSETDQRLLEQAVAPVSGAALTVLVVLMAVSAELSARVGRRVDGIYHVVAAGVVALGSLALAMRGGLDSPGRAAVVFGVCGFAGLLANVRWRTVLLSYAGAAVLLGACVYAFLWGEPALPAQRLWSLGLLTHATGALIVGLLVARLAGAERPAVEVFVAPLLRAALVSSLLAVLPLLFAVEREWMTSLALCLGWLAVLWLVISWVERWPVLFAGFQTALGASVVCGVTAWLQWREWVQDYPAGLGDPRSLQAYGIALGVLGVLWVAARLGLRSNERAQVLVEPPWPAVDRVGLGALVVGLLPLALYGVAPGVNGELAPPREGIWLGSAAHAHAYGPGAWAMLGALAVALAAALWDRWNKAALIGLVLLAVTVPLLAAGRFTDELATASALRWGLACCFVVCSAALWLREPIAASASRFDGPVSLGPVVRALLLVGTVAPVLVLTAVAAGLRISGETLGGPAPASFFARVGSLPSNLVPLVLVSMGLVGHGLRERASGYAFAAGLLANATLMGGYVLAVVTGGGQINATEWVRVFQLGSAGAAIWAIGWLMSRRWVAAWRHEPGNPMAYPLMLTQVLMAVAGMGVLLVVAVSGLTLEMPPDTAILAWMVEMGSLLGWLALILTVTAAAVRSWQLRSAVPLNLVGAAGMAALALLACSVERLAPNWGYRTLMLGCGGYALAWALTLACQASIRTRRSIDVLIELSGAAALWVCVAGPASVLLALKAAIVFEQHLWAAGAILMASAAGAVMAVQRRQEPWAFVSGLGVNLAAALVVWHLYLPKPLTEWGIVLWQGQALACGGVALLWLAMRKRLYGRLELTVSAGPLLAVQTVLGLTVNGFILVWPTLSIIAEPWHSLPGEFARAGDAGGWLALLVATAAAVWYTGQVAPRHRLQILAIFGVGVGALVACVAARWDAGNWLSYHLLMGSWAELGIWILLGGIIAARLRTWEVPANPTSETRRAAHWFAALLPADLARRWLEGIGIVVVLLAVRGGWADPQRPYWSAGVTLVVCALATTMALWFRLERYAWASGLLVNLAGILVWVARGPDTFTSFLAVNAACLAAGSVFWTLLDLGRSVPSRPLDVSRPHWPFAHVSAVLALALVGMVIALDVGGSRTDAAWRTTDSLTWIGLVATAMAFGVLMWDARASFPFIGLYGSGLFAIGLVLHELRLSPDRFWWAGSLAWAAYLVLTSALRWGGESMLESAKGFGVPERSNGWLVGWFIPTQVTLAGVIAILSVWMTLDFGALTDRLAGPAAAALLIPVGVLLAVSRPLTGLRHATLIIGVLALTELGWAVLGSQGPAPWLHRNALLMVALALATAGYGILLPRLLRDYPDWADCGRRIGPVLAVLAALQLVIVLVQETLLFDPETHRAPLAVWGIVAVIVGLALLIVAAFRFAVVPGRDPFGLSERGRTLYVYGAEVLVLLLLMHLRLNVPQLFSSIVRQYWPMAVMVIAFLGVGISELFDRKGLRVLAEPLRRTGVFLPLLPLLAFWMRDFTGMRESLSSAMPGSQPLLAYLDQMQGHYTFHALVWFTLGLLYAFVAMSRGSFRFALLAALAANFGLWVIFANHSGLAFAAHPQLWLIPLALILLVAEHFNRDKLTEAQATALRYVALCVLYVSSTADMFIAGIGKSVWMPVILAVLSIIGVLTGILLRVRAFLFLGLTFLFVVVFTMIWHAAVDREQTWVWYVSGIVLGAAILALFALFEKRRNDVLRVMRELKKWE